MIPVPSAPTKTGVFWTQFPATALTDRDGRPVDWTDHKAAHRAVSRLFQPRLPGNQGERRAESGILYRVDALGPQNGATVLVQSLVPPELTPAESRSTEVSRKGWEFALGDQVAIRIAVNPIARTTRYFTDADKTTATQTSNRPGHEDAVPRYDEESAKAAGKKPGQRIRENVRQTARVVPVDEIEGWLSGKLGESFSSLQVINHYRDRSQSGPHALVVDSIDAIAVVGDPSKLVQARLEGVGRSKSYGCGLMTATRLG